MSDQEMTREQRPARPPRRDPEDRGGREARSVNDLLDKLELEISNARNMPFSSKCLVDREEALYLVSMIRESLPTELERARWVLQQNLQLINDARREADAVIRDAEVQMARMIDEHEVTQKARQSAAMLLEEAERNSDQIRDQAIAYTREMLINLEDHLTGMLVNIKENQKELE